jgi:glyoxylase-like metal-dependent hydrolase (beta-lactamase superfamily II)
MSPIEPYEVYAIKYAENLASLRSNVFLGGDRHDGPMPMDYFVWAIVGNGRSFVVDVGFKREVAQRRKRDRLICPTEGLRNLAIDSEAVQDVIITHLHYDHAGNLDLFPNARIHLQDREMQFATGRLMGHRAIAHGFEEEDVVQMVRKVFRRKAAFHDGDEEIAPGVSLHLVGGHTSGMQVVRVWTRRGWVVLASDAAHYYANVAKERPFMWSVNLAEVIDAERKLFKLAETPDHVIPGHDPAVMQQYAPPAPELQGSVVRLDAEPRFSAFSPKPG